MSIAKTEPAIRLEDVLTAYAVTGSPEVTANKLGLNVNSINILVSTPQFQAALRKHLTVELQGAAAVSIKLLRSIVESTTAYERDKAAAAKALLALAGYVAPKAQDQKHATASPSDMSSEDLRAFVAKAEAELAARAAPVNAQIEAKPDGQVIDML